LDKRINAILLIGITAITVVYATQENKSDDSVHIAAETNECAEVNIVSESTDASYTIQAVAKSIELLELSTESSPDHPLEAGMWGRGLARGAYGLEGVYAVRLDAVYTGQEAADLVDRYGIYKSDALEGTSFEVAVFTYTCDPTAKYMDIRIEGLDGEKLELEGNSYSMRTYDIWDEVQETEPGLYSQVYVYYEVPDGCGEYLLEVGEQAKADGLCHTGCYLVENPD
jgi:hypothetical protein